MLLWVDLWKTWINLDKYPRKHADKWPQSVHKSNVRNETNLDLGQKKDQFLFFFNVGIEKSHMLWPVLNYTEMLIQADIPTPELRLHQNEFNKSVRSAGSCSIMVILLALCMSRSDTHVRSGASHLSEIIFPQHNKQYPARLFQLTSSLINSQSQFCSKNSSTGKDKVVICVILRLNALSLANQLQFLLACWIARGSTPSPFHTKAAPVTLMTLEKKKPFLAQIIWNCPLNFSFRSKAAYRQQFCVGRPLAPLILASSDPECVCV